MKTKQFLLSLAMSIMLAACGGGDGAGRGVGASPVFAADPPQAVLPQFAAQVTFGDSLSDVGTYAVGAIAAGGGGKFTINGDGTAQHPELVGKIWNEMIASRFALPAPCAAQTGLQGDPARGLSVPVVNHPGCLNYAQGGARVREPIGPGNAAAGSPIGELTVPVANQVENHLALTGRRFQGNELVFVMAGANDVVAQWNQLAQGAAAAAQAAGPDPAAQAQARAVWLTANGPAAIAAVATAAGDLAGIIRTQIVANGANYVVVNNVPDLSATPQGAVQEPALRALIQATVQEFNRVLKAGLDLEPKVVQVDVYSLLQDATRNPAFYGLTNTTAPACGPNALGGHSLLCTVFNVYPVDVSHFLYADTVHPTPYAHWLVARQVLLAMAAKGWAAS
jgi:phospholipase/lecithinase/hemolysin